VLDPILANDTGAARLDPDGELVVSPLSAEQVPAVAVALCDEASERLPHVDLPSLLIEVDAWTGFTDHLLHAGGATHRFPDLRRNLYAAVMAQATNLGFTGQRFPQRGKSLTARALSRYFVDEGTTTYTHVADQHSTYGTKVIPSTVRDATYVLDEILGNPTDLPIAEHTVDTAGQTLAVFAIFDLLSLRFSPRIRDLPSRRLYRLGSGSELSAFPHAGPLLTRPIQTDLIVAHWDELLRLAASFKFGHTTASLLLAKLQAGSRQNALARALIEYGRLVRTVFLLRYLADADLRHKIGGQLNKGESLNALRRALFFANQGHVRRAHHDDQTEQALCLTVVTNAVVLWNTVYLQDARAAMADAGRPVGDDAAVHLSPTQSDHINPDGNYTFDIERELTRTGRRPLKPIGHPRPKQPFLRRGDGNPPP
jgi:TnpA family transposase